MPFESESKPNYSTKLSVIRAAFSLTVEVDAPALALRSKIIIINIPDYHWFLKDSKSTISKALSPFFALVNSTRPLQDRPALLPPEQYADDRRAFLISIVGNDATFPWRNQTTTKFFNFSETWEWIEMQLCRYRAQESAPSEPSSQGDPPLTVSSTKPPNVPLPERDNNGAQSSQLEPIDDRQTPASQLNLTQRTPSVSPLTANPHVRGPPVDAEREFNGLNPDPVNRLDNGTGSDFTGNDNGRESIDVEEIQGFEST